MNKTTWGLLAFAAAVSLRGCHEGSKNSDSSSSTRPRAPSVTGMAADARILSALHAKDREEVEMGRMAQSKGTTDAVRRYGQRLERDHAAHDAKVQDTARTVGITLADPPMDHKAGKDPMSDLNAMSGDTFDRRFAEMMQQGHRDVIKMVEEAQASVQRTEVRDLLAQTLPTLREHEKLAGELLRR